MFAKFINNITGGGKCKKCPDSIAQTQQIMNNVQDGIIVAASGDGALLFVNEVGQTVIGSKVADFNVDGKRISG